MKKAQLLLSVCRVIPAIDIEYHLFRRHGVSCDKPVYHCTSHLAYVPLAGSILQASYCGLTG